MTDGKRATNPLFQRTFHIKDQGECKALYKDWATTYDATMVDELAYLAPQTVVSVLANHLADKQASILDLGCGTGLVGESLQRLGFDAIDGVDFSQEMLNVAQGKNLYRRLIQADLTAATDLPSEEYDAAISAGLFTYGHLDAQCLGEIFRTIKPGGLFVSAIRRPIWEEYGFQAQFADWEENQQVKILSKELANNYSNVENNDGVYLVAQKLKEWSVRGTREQDS